jgi:hypothetical protein
MMAKTKSLSPVQFRHGDIPTLVHSILLETGLSPSRLELEVTEGVLIDDFARTVSILRRLKALGVRIAMDDFGTGYSSLSYLQAFPFDKIKIDQRFIRRCGRFERDVRPSVSRTFYALLPTIPHPPDGRPSPARAETAAVVASMEKPRIAEIVPPAIIPVAWRIA